MIMSNNKLIESNNEILGIDKNEYITYFNFYYTKQELLNREEK